jgi:hypothetical protein
MMLYVYEAETMAVVARIEGEDNATCERIAEERYGDTDRYGWTYSPALGTSGGCYETTATITIDAAASAAARALGRKGRAVNSEAQQGAARANGAKGGRPKLRRVSVHANYSKERGSVELILRDGKTATRRQYEDALRRLHAAVGDYLRLDDGTEGETLVYDGEDLWAVLA